MATPASSITKRHHKPEGVLPHITKLGTHLPLVASQKKPDYVFPTEVFVSGNKTRVDWIKTFLNQVHDNSKQAGELTLEDKIERL
jgi:hypothetical protein